MHPKYYVKAIGAGILALLGALIAGADDGVTLTEALRAVATGVGAGIGVYLTPANANPDTDDDDDPAL